MKFFRGGGYNITGDPVWLAAFAAGALPPRGEVLDAGIGTGGAALCLLQHSPDLQITGIDVSEQMLAECAANAKLNGRDIKLVRGDITAWKTNRTFDAVITNPPYFKGTARNDGTLHHNADLCGWTRACLKRVKPRGYFYCIADAAAAAEIISALAAGRAGDITIVPLFGRPAKTGQVAERALISARLGARGGTKIYAPMNMNDDGVLRDADLI